MGRDRLAATAHDVANGAHLSPLRVIQIAAEKVPAVNYALGLAGIAAAAALVVSFVGSGKSAIILLSLTFAGAVLLFVFSRLTLASKRSTQAAGVTLVWVVVTFFSVFMFFTVTAFAFKWPDPWAAFLGIKNADVANAECAQKVQKMWSQFNSPINQTSDAIALAREVASCDSFQSNALQGAVAFYAADFFNAAQFFESAHRLKPDNHVATRNLADTYVELGRLADARVLYDQLPKSTPLWNYKMGRLLLYSGRYDEARELLSKIGTDFSEDGNIPGKARVLEAAAIVGLAGTLADNGQRQDALSQARHIFRQGTNADLEAWKTILRTGKTRYEGYQRTVELLKPYLGEWFQSTAAELR